MPAMVNVLVAKQQTTNMAPDFKQVPCSAAMSLKPHQSVLKALG